MKWLAPPRHEDEESARIAKVVHVVGIGNLVAVMHAIFSNLAVGNLVPVLVLCADALLAVGCLVLNLRGALSLASHLLVFSAIALSASLQFVGRHGAHDVAVLIYPCAIVLAGALVERRWFIAFVVLAMAAYATQYTLELRGIVRYQPSHFLELRLLVDAEVILAATGLCAGLFMGSLRRSMARSRAALASLRESEVLYRSLFESVSEAIVIHDPADGRIVDANHRASEWFGYSTAELRARTVADLSANAPGYTQEEAMARIRQTVAGRSQLFEWQARARDGRLFWVEVNMHAALVGGAQRVLVSLRDIDERKRAEAEKERLQEQLRQAQKLESIGRLAGGVAHDFNNLLTCIIGNVELSARDASASFSIRQNLGEIGHAARRAAELTSHLLAFSRKQPIVPKPIALQDLMGSVERLLRRLLGETVAVSSSVAEGVGCIRADPGQIEQILVNLAVNARDAMPEGGRMVIAAENVTIDQAFSVAHPGAEIGEFVRIRVGDTGTGMSAAVREHMFEPFFTTKGPGKGTGLGLAMVFGAVQQNHGFIVVDSQEGRGTVVDLHFPRWFGEVQASPLAPTIASLPKGHERILLVEDDASVRALAERVLAQLGYRVEAYATGQEALAIVQTDRDFDLLLTDVILPDINGRVLATRLLAARPRLRVLYCSGYTGDVIAAHGVVDEGQGFLPKPFTPDELASKVRARLDAAV